MIKYRADNLDFRKTYERISKNSLQFENICTKEIPKSNKENTRLGLSYWENELLSTYLSGIIENAVMVDLTSDELKKKYHMNPQRLSKDQTGFSDYWYLILAMNGYTSVYEFKDFKEPILFPDVTYVDSLITILERDRNNK